MKKKIFTDVYEEADKARKSLCKLKFLSSNEIFREPKVKKLPRAFK